VLCIYDVVVEYGGGD